MPAIRAAGRTAAHWGRLAQEGLNHLLWPAVCDCCRTAIAETDKRLCRDCWNELLSCTAGDYCPGCGREASRYALIDGRCAGCDISKIHFDGIARGGVYEDVLRDLILAFKFQDRTELATHLCFLASAALKGSPFQDEIDLFVPVPLHWRRRVERGYNQSKLIAKGLGHPAAVTADLVRVRYTQRQWSLTPAKRRKNVAGAFAVRRGHNYSGKRLCLVDDITTSHATLNECAKTLRAAGAVKIFACVVAVAMQDAC
ncbi:MAG: ComF family protein [Phycisphaerae bacterium]|nr:ComF family protein [Phycisphaerae bacterium]